MVCSHIFVFINIRDAIVLSCEVLVPSFHDSNRTGVVPLADPKSVGSIERKAASSSKSGRFNCAPLPAYPR